MLGGLASVVAVLVLLILLFSLLLCRRKDKKHSGSIYYAESGGASFVSSTSLSGHVRRVLLEDKRDYLGGECLKLVNAEGHSQFFSLASPAHPCTLRSAKSSHYGGSAYSTRQAGKNQSKELRFEVPEQRLSLNAPLPTRRASELS